MRTRTTAGEFSNVALIELRENNLLESFDKITKIFFNVEITKAILENVNCILEVTKFDENKNNPPKGTYANYYIQQKDGVKINVDEIVIKFLNTKVLKGDLFMMVEETLNFPTDSILKSKVSNYSFPIVGITCRGYTISFTQLDFDYIENKVLMIMKDIFEKKNYAISANGDVVLIDKPSIIYL